MGAAFPFWFAHDPITFKTGRNTMPTHQKDKRTKEQILKLLDRAIEQEERLGDKIKNLEAELLSCRKKAEDPRHELAEGAFPASKVSFRIDYYRNSEKSPLKGIIEQLSSRQSRTFEGEGHNEIGHFMNRFLREEATASKRKTNNGKNKGADKPEPQAPVEETKISVSGETVAPDHTDSRLLRRLKHTVIGSHQSSEVAAVQTDASPESKDVEVPAPRSARVERLLALSLAPEPGAGNRNAGQTPGELPEQDTPDGALSRSGLLQRLREQYFDSLETAV